MLKINVNAVFLDEQSLPEDNIYLWAYHIKIFNKYDQAIIIKKRIFEVVDVLGQRQIIEGVGVANNEPKILPGDMFEYASGVLLNQPSGFFTGYYEVQKDDGEIDRAEIPSFSLDSKYGAIKNQ